MNKMEAKYSSYKKKQNYLADLFRQASQVSSELDLNRLCLSLKHLGRKIYNETFKIQIVGTFKNGKSTFINSFLGEDVLPAYALPCTAVINEVKYGVEKKAVLHFKNPLPDKLPSELSPLAKAHMKKHLPGVIPPMEIKYNEIEDYVVIPIGKDPKEMLMESPYEKVELFWPLDLLKNGVEIIDSPGLNEHATRTKVTMDYLSKADAIIFVLSATSLCSLEEMKFIENTLHAQGFNDTFFVVNRFDLVVDAEKRNVIEYARAKLSKYTKFGESGIFFLSAKNSLDAKKAGDQTKLAISNMPPFEERLSAFLTNEKGNAKLSQPTYELRRILIGEMVNKAIPSQRKLVSTSLDELKRRYDAVKPKLFQLRSKKEQSLKKISLQIERSRYEFENASRAIVSRFSDSVNAWVDEFVPETKVGVMPGKEKIKKLTGEITDYVSERITMEQNAWKNSVLIPMLEEKATEIFSEAESDFKNLFTELDSVQLEMCAGASVTASNVPVWKRVAGVAGGIVTGDLSGAVAGGTVALSSDMAKKVGFRVGAQSILLAIGVLNPFALSAVIFGTLVFGLAKNESNIEKKVKEKVCSEFISSLNSSVEENTKILTDAIINKFKDVASTMVSSLDAEISQTENQIKSLISEMEKGRENVMIKQKMLDDSQRKCKEIFAKSDVLIKSFNQ